MGVAGVSEQTKQKNNHFVPQSYLVRFHSVSERQVGLYNLKSGRMIEIAPIKSQCARDYFYTKNPVFEKEFSKLEGRQKQLFERIVGENYLPEGNSEDHHALLSSIMFQAGRTMTTVAHQNHLANEFGKAMLRKHFEKEGKDDLLAVLPQVKITMPDVVLDSIGQHLAMYPLLGDMDATLFVNQSKEDFLTSDHPIALCNNLPASSPYGANVGFSSRGLIVVFPLSPRVLLFLSDPEVYKIAHNERRVAKLNKIRDVVELNLPQCFNAHENLYFASAANVQETLLAFRLRRDYLRTDLPALSEISAKTPTGRTGVLLSMPGPNRRMRLPKAVEIRRAAKTGRYVQGDAFVRDPLRTAVVRKELERLHKMREKATREAEKQQNKKLADADP